MCAKERKPRFLEHKSTFTSLKPLQTHTVIAEEKRAKRRSNLPDIKEVRVFKEDWGGPNLGGFLFFFQKLVGICRKFSDPKAPKIEVIQDRPPGLKFSSGIENF